MIERMPPHNLAAERAVLGCCLVDPRYAVGACEEAFGESDEWLYDPQHRVIYGAVRRAMRERGTDAASVLVAATESGQQISFADLGEMMNLVPSAAAITSYLPAVRDAWMLRRLLASATRICQSCHDSTDSRETIDAAEAEILAVTRSQVGGNETASGVGLSIAATRHAEAVFAEAKGQGPQRILTGFPRLDSMVSLLPGNLGIIAARPAVGKTAFALQVCGHAAANQIPCAFLSLEMTVEELGFRLASQLSGVSKNALAGAEDATLARFGEGAEKIARLPLHVVSGPMTVWQVRRALRRMVQQHGVKLAVVDYLQRIQGDGRLKNMNERVGAISNALKDVAMELGIVLLAICTINREGDDGRPRLSQLGWSGTIEYDVNHGWLLWRNKQSELVTEQPVELVIEKQRGGQEGLIQLTFDKPTTSFRETETATKHPTFDE